MGEEWDEGTPIKDEGDGGGMPKGSRQLGILDNLFCDPEGG